MKTLVAICLALALGACASQPKFNTWSGARRTDAQRRADELEERERLETARDEERARRRAEYLATRTSTAVIILDADGLDRSVRKVAEDRKRHEQLNEDLKAIGR